MSGAKIGRLTKGDGEKISKLSNDRLIKELAHCNFNRNIPKCVKELMERGLSKEEIDRRVAAYGE